MWNPFARAKVLCPRFATPGEVALKKRVEELEDELREAPYKEREKLLGNYGHRIGSKDLDMIAMQARIRRVEPSLRIARENFRWIVYSGRLLPAAQLNQIDSLLGFRLDRS